MATVGIHLVWTSYGTWLPGDDRDHWSPLFDFYGRVIERGGQLNRADLVTEQAARELMTEPAKVLTAEERRVVAETLGTLVRGPGQPLAYAAAIEETHVHLLVGPVAEDIGKATGRFKGKTSSAVLDLPTNRGRKRTWTGKYWKVFLFDEVAFYAVKLYIEEHNLRRGLGHRRMRG
jgi:REP element-mobilizing transposase RayT